MIINLKIDFSQFEEKARSLEKALQEVPFALSLALNKAAVNARQVLVQSTWPKSVTVRNPGFLSRALRTKFSTKTNLKIEIYDDLGRAHLKKHAVGGTKVAKGRNLAIPLPGRVQYGAHGVFKSQRPKAMAKRKRAFVTDKGIFLKIGRNQKQLIYAFKPTATIKPDVPFYTDFVEAIRQEMKVNFAPAMVRAMKPRR